MVRVLRAVETGLPMLRAANTGLSLAIDPLGRVTAQLAAGEAGVLDVVPDQPLSGGTIFERVGDLPFWAAVLAGLVVAWFSSRRPRRVA